MTRLDRWGSYGGGYVGVQGMRWSILLCALFLGACEGSFFRPEHLGKKVSLEKSYAARDACLARSVQADGQAADPASAARTAAAACMAETDRLIELVNRDGDPRVAARIRQDSEFRATGMALKARGQESG